MLSDDDVTGNGLRPDFPEPNWVKLYSLSLVFVGSVVGMLSMGYLGDLIGVQRALKVTNLLIVVGAISSALLSWGSAATVWSVISASRFVLGLGVGGNYPLSAAKASAGDMSPQEAVAKAAASFFWQGPGATAPYLVALALLQLPQSANVTSLQFRVLLGAGALPAMIVLWAVSREPDPPPAKKNRCG